MVVCVCVLKHLKHVFKSSCKPLEFMRTGCLNPTESDCSNPVMIGFFVKSCDVGFLLLGGCVIKHLKHVCKLFSFSHWS
jgi:hypothetical protein